MYLTRVVGLRFAAGKNRDTWTELSDDDRGGGWMVCMLPDFGYKSNKSAHMANLWEIQDAYVATLISERIASIIIVIDVANRELACFL